ncbi:MAG TPA: PKD domain-containing protein [Flavobacteriales bacterium]|nr:PKD domain-containing protein [Flavobacteriales bacterium]HIO67907.1 PKD domain-containing protein [Flavobacteriales bacterium]
MTLRYLFCLLSTLYGFSLLAQEWKREIGHVDITPVSFNGKSSNYCPVYYGDRLLFTSTRGNKEFFQRRDPVTDQSLSLLFSVAKTDSSNWGEVKAVGGDLSRYIHYGPACLNAQQDKIYFTRNNDDTKIVELTNNLGIYIADFKDGVIGSTQAFEHNHAKFDFGQPSVTHDGNKLYFVANNPSGFGGTDLYVSNLVEGRWSAPTNLGKHINTKRNELFPYSHANGKLYFSSDGRAGTRGLDLFYTEEVNGQLIEPVALHDSFNSEADDFGIVMDSSGLHGYFSSNRVTENDTDQIFEFQIHQYWPKFENCTDLSRQQYCYHFHEKSLKKRESMLFVYEWDFGDGHKVRSLAADHCFAGPGTYQIQLNVIDTISGTETKNVAHYDLQVENPQAVIITAPNTVKVGQPFNMHGHATAINGFVPKRYYWNLGGVERIRGDASGITFEREGDVIIELGILGLNKKGKERKYCSTKTISVIK